MKVNAYIVDDEIASRELLKFHLLKFDFINVCGEASNISDAYKDLNNFQKTIHLLFLDISMPNGNGFELIEKLELDDLKIVFVTAHSEFSIKAIKYQVFDYLVKPILFEEIENTLNRYIELNDKLKSKDEFFVPSNGDYQLISVNDVIRIESEGNYSTIFLKNNRSFVITKNMKKIQDEYFTHKNFIRVHQSHLINTKFISAVSLKKSQITLLDDSEIPLARSRKNDFLNNYKL